ncbi:MAG: 50S ribosomal protein L13 [Polyangiaceae bacterium]|nr:50S ribosomal protein L13 [Polyangiaceae bacterium]
MATPEAAAEKPTPIARRNPNKGFVATKEQADASRAWWVVDATGKSLGRLASAVAHVIRGKHKPTFSPHVDVGDFVIVVNADKIKLTGNKLDQKLYSHHSGIPGGLKQESVRRIMARKPVFPVEKAVKGMLPKNVLGRAMFTKLKVYATPDHPHAAQKPQVLEIK